MSQRRHVALIIESSRGYGRGLLWGIARYVRDYSPWSLFCQDRGLGEDIPAWLRHWKGDGIIVRVESSAMERVILRKRVPAVNLRSLPRLHLPLIETDDDAVAQLAAEHLMERSFHVFGYCGFAGVDYSRRRQVSFEAAVAAAGYPCHVYPPVRRTIRRRIPGIPAVDTSASRGQGRIRQHEQHGLLYEEALIQWVTSLPKPIGIMACNDIRGQQLLNACREAKVSVPEEVAVIGVDNDRLLCELSDPPLSSVEPDTRRIGYEAAALLDRMMQGERPPSETLFVPPRGVVTRQSTDVLAIDDREVALAVRYIREHACEGINVGDVLRKVPMTRVTLKRRFEKLLGRSPKAEIVRVQLSRVKRLLAETDMSQSRIAELAGFNHPEYLSALFKSKTGQTPGQYRAARQQIDEKMPVE
jgi:LacI family transcriptional regulator